MYLSDILYTVTQ